MMRQRVCAPGFEQVAELFDELHGGDAIGASFAVTHGGKQVLDLWGGVRPDGKQWDANTKCVIASGTKGIMAVAILICVERGLVDLDAPLASLWPEFAHGGKGKVTVGEAMAHVAGVPGLERKVSPAEFADTAFMAGLVAEQLPIVPIGLPSYHAATYGWIASEIIRRVDGRSAGRFVADEIANPLALDLYIGAPEAVLGDVTPTTRSADFNYTALLNPDADPRLQYVYGVLPTELLGSTEMAKLEFPGGGGVATAQAMSRVYAALVNGGMLDGVRILQPETIALGLLQRSEGNDPLSGRLLRFGVGFELNPNPSCLGEPEDAFGHTGAGGSTHGGWPSQQTSFSYVMGEFRPETNDGRARRLLAALLEANNLSR
jgi:CubicO group peptidase (beta-lactamase class C family)